MVETELNQFIYTYNYTPCEAAPDHKSPAEVSFERKFHFENTIGDCNDLPRTVTSA